MAAIKYVIQYVHIWSYVMVEGQYMAAIKYRGEGHRAVHWGHRKICYPYLGRFPTSIGAVVTTKMFPLPEIFLDSSIVV